jgi:hypothetical protein
MWHLFIAVVLAALPHSDLGKFPYSDHKHSAGVQLQVASQKFQTNVSITSTMCLMP